MKGKRKYNITIMVNIIMGILAMAMIFTKQVEALTLVFTAFSVVNGAYMGANYGEHKVGNGK